MRFATFSTDANGSPWVFVRVVVVSVRGVAASSSTAIPERAKFWGSERFFLGGDDAMHVRDDSFHCIREASEFGKPKASCNWGIKIQEMNTTKMSRRPFRISLHLQQD